MDDDDGWMMMKMIDDVYCVCPREGLCVVLLLSVCCVRLMIVMKRIIKESNDLYYITYDLYEYMNQFWYWREVECE